MYSHLIHSLFNHTCLLSIALTSLWLRLPSVLDIDLLCCDLFSNWSNIQYSLDDRCGQFLKHELFQLTLEKRVIHTIRVIQNEQTLAAYTLCLCFFLR